ncbi:MAG: agmatine deiminase [Lachnospiraceae bacterium]|nr:agmatine deiminase [Lachnospiraceae bacterium]
MTRRMPAEFESHRGTIMIFPEREGSWPYQAKQAQRVFAGIIKEIAKDEEVHVVVSPRTEDAARALLKGTEGVFFYNIETDDAWARDTAPTFVYEDDTLKGIDWCFNAWGGEYDGLYAKWDRDNALASAICNRLGYETIDMQGFVLEGGSIHTDGAGTLLTTECCLLSPGRNPKMTKQEIEDTLLDKLGGERMIWLPEGIYNDETNGHVDNICAFIAPGEVVLGWTDKKDDPQYELSMKDLEILENAGIKVHKLPIPDVPVCITPADLEGYVFEVGEDVRETGERLAASYVNFYFTNKSVILPQFGGENEESDKRAVSIMKELCPRRRIVPVPARDIIVGGGNIHCITQQIPGRCK